MLQINERKQIVSAVCNIHIALVLWIAGTATWGIVITIIFGLSLRKPKYYCNETNGELEIKRDSSICILLNNGTIIPAHIDYNRTEETIVFYTGVACLVCTGIHLIGCCISCYRIPTIDTNEYQKPIDITVI